MKGPTCVTGASGFLASHVVEQLLAAGTTVHATVRDPGKAASVGHLQAMPGAERLKLFAADLLDEGAYDEAVAGCASVIHTASPYSLTVEDPQKELVDPALKGTRNVLMAAKRAGVRRVVVTSSMAAVTDEPDGRLLTEADWNDASSLDRNPYYYSKVVAEREAWRIAEAEDLDVVVINPFLVVGPCHTRALNTSNGVVRDVLAGSYPGVLALQWGFVDVRDVAAAHVVAVSTGSGRYVCAAEVRSMRDTIALLRELGFAGRAPTLGLDGGVGTALVRLGALFQPPGVRTYLRTHLGRELRFDHAKIVRELGISFRPLAETLSDTVEDLIRWEHLPASVRGSEFGSALLGP